MNPSKIEELKEIKLLTDQIKTNLLEIDDLALVGSLGSDLRDAGGYAIFLKNALEEINDLLPIDPDCTLMDAERNARSLKAELKEIEDLLPIDPNILDNIASDASSIHQLLTELNENLPPEDCLDSLATDSQSIRDNLKEAVELKAQAEISGE